MKRRIVDYATRAKEDAAWIYRTVESASSPNIALEYVKRIRDFCDRLEYGAERGHQRDDIRPGLRVVGFERRVTVAFVVETERVVILRIFYGGRDWKGDMQ